MSNRCAAGANDQELGSYVRLLQVTRKQGSNFKINEKNDSFVVIKSPRVDCGGLLCVASESLGSPC